jgi:parvulin-like peptidyl-prolyl isomerase
MIEIDAPPITMASFSSLSLTPDEVIHFLKQEIRFRDVVQGLLQQKVISKTALDRAIEVTPGEVQQEADRQRIQRRLESASSTYAWLQEQLISVEDWESGIYEMLLKQKVAESLFAHEVDRYYAEHRLDFEQVSLYRISVPYQQLSQELFYQIEESEIGFYEAAHLYDIDERRRSQCGYEGRFYRWNLDPDIASIVFSANLKEIIGPIPNQQSYDLLLVEEFIASELTPATRQDILNKLFHEWLDAEVNTLLQSL